MEPNAKDQTKPFGPGEANFTGNVARRTRATQRLTMRVFVLNADKSPLSMCKPARARMLLREGRAAVFRRYPFTIILKETVKNPIVEDVRVKIDPGAKATGLAVASERTGEVVFAAELTHRGKAIKADLETRRALRRGRRGRHTRYRAPRFFNRTRPKGWLPPSLQHRVETIMTWIEKFRRFAPVEALSQELVRFDMQAMERPGISGVEYQQGELAGYEIREALLEKWGRCCAYCGVENVPLQVEHIRPRGRGGSNRFSNLTLACEPCNTRKGTQSIEEFLAGKPTLLAKIKAQIRRPLDAAAAVNATRWALFDRLKATGLPVEAGSGGRTKFNRANLDLPKTHWIDAACVGKSGANVRVDVAMAPLKVIAKGHGSRQMCGTDKFGFPTRHKARSPFVQGFQTGDIVRARVPKGKKVGTHEGRVLCRTSGSFDIATDVGRATGISHRYCNTVHRKDGYAYA
jgi:5-methylcytosine-specific restriction endonuclease McrA